jgi:hypothetical protein
MAARHYILLARLDRWQVGVVAGGKVAWSDVPAPEPDSGDTPADAMARTLRQSGYRGEGVCVAIDGASVFAARVSTEGIPSRQRREALRYRLEEQLPLDAEGTTADFVPLGGGVSLGIAAETAPLRDLLDGLDARGVEVAAIAPAGFLACEEALRRQGAAEIAAIVWDEGSRELLRLRAGKPAALYAAGSDEALRLRLRADLLGSPAGENSRALLLGDGSESIENELTSAGVEIVRSEESPRDLAALAARRVLRGRRGWANLRQDALGLEDPWKPVRRPLQLAAVLAALLLIAVSAVFYLRTREYNQRAEQYDDRQATVFGLLYPNRPVPAYVKPYLQTELRKLSGLSGADVEVPARPRAMETLCRILANLPPSMRLRILELRVSPTTVLIEGEVRSHTDAQVIFQALQEEGFDVTQPDTERLREKGVAFTLTGKPGRPQTATRSGGTSGGSTQ